MGFLVRARVRVMAAAALLCLCEGALAQTPTSGQALPLARKDAPPTQADQAEARERYARAMQMVGEARYDVALIEMQRAYTLNPSYRILYNLASIQAHLGDAASAVENFEKYLANGGSEIPAARASEVTQEIARLRPRVGTVDLVVKDAGAEILVDDVVIGRSPFRRIIAVNAGQHRFTAAKSGAPPTTRVVSVAGMDSLVLELELVGATTAAANANANAEKPAPHAATAPQGAHSPDREVGAAALPGTPWAAWLATGLLAGGTIAAGIATQRSIDKLNEARDRPGASRQELDDKASASYRNAVITDVLLGATAITGAFSLYYTLRRGSSSDTAPTPHRPSVTAVPGGVVVRGSF